MNYEKIILELLDRIQTLEEKVEILEKNSGSNNVTNLNYSSDRKVSLTQRARDYIAECKKQAKKEGKSEITLLCNDIQIALGVTNRTPCICTAMYDAMKGEDEVLSAPPSGKSTTVLVKYYLNEED